MSTRVGIAGFRGYSGAELIRLLEHHPQAQPVLLEHRSDNGDRPQPLNAKTPPAIPCTPEAVEGEGSRLCSWPRQRMSRWASRPLYSRPVQK